MNLYVTLLWVLVVVEVECKKRKVYPTYPSPPNSSLLHRITDAIFVEEKLVCANLTCTDVLRKVNEFEVYNTLGTRLYSDVVNMNHSGPFRIPIFPALFDWIFISTFNKQHQKIDILYGNVKIARTIYVKTDALNGFKRRILPRLSHPFVLYSGSNDYTIPNNLDLRYNSTEYQRIYLPIWQSITEHPLLLHWYVENHDELHPKVSTMPIGLNPKEFHPDDRSSFVPEENLTQLWQRPLKILSIDRVRPGLQWKDRKDTHAWCSQIGRVCHAVDKELNHSQFVATVTSYPFILCVHGGGIGNFSNFLMFTFFSLLLICE